MKRYRFLPILLLALLLLSSCDSPIHLRSDVPDPKLRDEVRRLAAAQLGKLEDKLTDFERWQVDRLLERLVPLRQNRAVQGRWALDSREEELVYQLNQLYEDCTRRYLGDLGGWSADEEKMETLAEYDVTAGGALEPADGEDSYRVLWELVGAMLPPGSLDAFDRFTVFTDGEEEILAYVVPTDEEGARWELAVDPMDTGDAATFAETVFHEYCHYLTLNSEQVIYGGAPAYGCYAESELAARADSYLTAFYQAFWTDYLDDRLADPETYGFYLRHADDFLTGYAATNPSEDIAESFAYFVLYDKAEGDSIPAQKQNFFYAYPELVAFRDQARVQMGL